MNKYKFSLEKFRQIHGDAGEDWPELLDGKVICFTGPVGSILLEGDVKAYLVSKNWCVPLTPEEEAIEEAKIPKKIMRFSADKHAQDMEKIRGTVDWANLLDGRAAVFECDSVMTEVVVDGHIYLVHIDWCEPFD